MNFSYKSFVNEQGDEIFTDGFVTWNITRLIHYLKENKKWLYKLNKEKYEIFIRDDQTVDESKIDLVDLEQPVIVVERLKGRYILIDGIHRVRKAKKNNCEYIVAYMVPFEEHIKFLEHRRDFNFIVEEYEKVIY